MKKTTTLFALMMAFVALCVMTVSCGSDDENETNPQPVAVAEMVKGDYLGTLECSIMKQTIPFSNQSYQIEQVDENTVKVHVAEFTYKENMTISAFTVEGVKVSASGNDYQLAETEFNGKGKLGDFKGTLEGTVAMGRQLNLRFQIQYTAMPMPMVCAYVGDKQ